VILSHLRAAMLAAFPGINAPKKAFFRVVRSVAGRLNLQPVNATLDQVKNEVLSVVEVCPGVPGVTSTPTDGETCVVMLVGADGTPYVIARAAEGMPGHTPQEVRHDATSAIRLISKTASAGAKVYVGTTTFALARAVDVTSLLTELRASATTMSASGVPEVVAVGGIITAALSGVTITPTTKLEAQ
jgi:hypothetical protein